MSSVKMESIEFAKRHLNGSNDALSDEVYERDNDGLEDDKSDWESEDDDNLSRAYDNDHDRAFSNIASS